MMLSHFVDSLKIIIWIMIYMLLLAVLRINVTTYFHYHRA